MGSAVGLCASEQDNVLVQAALDRAIGETAIKNLEKAKHYFRSGAAGIINGLLVNLDVAAFEAAAPGLGELRSGCGCATPHNVTIDIYGEEFHFKASADEARRLIKTFERVLAARKDVTRLKRELAGAEAKSFNGVGIGEGIVVDDPDGVGKTEAAAYVPSWPGDRGAFYHGERGWIRST
jgi:hypothetical protein